MRPNLKLPVVIVVALILLGVALVSISSSGGSADGETEVVTAAPASTTTTDPGPSTAEIERWDRAVDRSNRNTWVWITTENNKQAWIAKTTERLAAEAAAKVAAKEKARQKAAESAPSQSNSRSAPAAEQGTGRCGGDLPPCYVMMRESGGNIRAQNPSSSASGKWQFLASTWAGFGGYSEAYLAPESVQDAKARALWAGGAGCSHWSAC